MKLWKVLIWAILSVVFFVVVISAGLWLIAAPVTSGASVVVDGVTVVRESSTDYTQLIIPGLLLVIGVLALTGSALSLWRALAPGARG